MNTNEELIERKLLIKQIRKEVFDEIEQYHVGTITNGVLIPDKPIDLDIGHLLIVPPDKYKEWFDES